MNMATHKRRGTSDAVQILYRRFYKGRPKRLKALQAARTADTVARKLIALPPECRSYTTAIGNPRKDHHPMALSRQGHAQGSRHSSGHSTPPLHSGRWHMSHWNPTASLFLTGRTYSLSSCHVFLISEARMASSWLNAGVQ